MCMDKKRKKGYVTGLGCSLVSFLLFILAVNNEWNLSGQILWGLTIFLCVLGVGSLWKPDSIGAVVSQLLENLSESGEEKSDSHNKQIQKKSSGVQVIASQGAKVNINVASEKKEQAEKSIAEEYHKLRERTAYLKELNNSVFKQWKNVSIYSDKFRIVTKMDKIDSDMFSRGKEFLSSENDETRTILETWEQLEIPIGKYDEVGEKVRKAITNHLSKSYPSLKDATFKKLF